MKRFFYIKLVLILMLVGVWESVRGQQYYGTIPDFSFTSSYPRLCNSDQISLSAISIEIKTKTTIRLRFTITFLSTSENYDRTVTIGQPFGMANRFLYCGSNPDVNKTSLKPRPPKPL